MVKPDPMFAALYPVHAFWTPERRRQKAAHLREERRWLREFMPLAEAAERLGTRRRGFCAGAVSAFTG
jgi:hypothetical protein